MTDKPKQSLLRWAFSYAPNVLRLSAFIGLCYVGITFATAKTVEAEVREIMLGMGSELMAFPGDTPGQVRQLTLNGATIQMRTGSVNQPIDAVMDHYERMCTRRDGQLAQQIEDLSQGLVQGEDGGAVDATAADGTLRWRSGPNGFVTCLDMGEDAVETEGLTARLSKFVDSGDLSDVGHLRYLYATATSEGQTHLVTMWNDSELNIYEMFPTDGSDARGSDLDGIPRLEGSQRILSAQEDGRAYGVALYFSDKSVDEIDAFYRESMPDAGFTFMDAMAGEQVDVEGSRVMALRNEDNRLISLTVTPTDDEQVAANIITIISSEEE